jgi:predicted outer membrane repeat protein
LPTSAQQLQLLPSHSICAIAVLLALVQLPLTRAARHWCRCFHCCRFLKEPDFQDTAVGGAVYAETTAAISGCRFLNNTANAAGAVALRDTATVDNCTFAGNSCPFQGGALKVNNNATLTISNSAFNDNIAVQVHTVVPLQKCLIWHTLQSNKHCICCAVHVSDCSPTASSDTVYSGTAQMHLCSLAVCASHAVTCMPSTVRSV